MMRSIRKRSPRVSGSRDHGPLVAQAAAYFRLPVDQVRADYRVYRRFHEQEGYERTLGERKTLSFEEAFLLYLGAQRTRPSHVVEIGTQFGKSTRRILDLVRLLRLECEVTAFDTTDALRFASSDEVHLVLHDLTDDFSERVLRPIGPGLIFLDAHPYALLKNVVGAFLWWSRSHPSVLAIHDCARSLYAPRMSIRRDDPGAVTSRTGLWERHVLEELLAVPNDALDDVVTPTHHLRIFDTPHGLALLAPLALLGAGEGGRPS